MTNLVDKCNSYIIDNARLSEQLATCQANNKVLRDALDFVLCTHDYVADDGRQAAKRALALLELTTDDTSLKAALAAERKRCKISLRNLSDDT